MSENQGFACIIGVGPGLGIAAAQRFAREGMHVALMSRSAEALERMAAPLIDEGLTISIVPMDCTDAASIGTAFTRVAELSGSAIDAMVYNAGSFVYGGILDIDVEQFVQAWQANCLGALLCARAALPLMLQQQRGTLIFTGATASVRGSAKFSGLAVGKFGLRALVQSIAREFGPQGIHASHVIIDGMINIPKVHESFPDRSEDALLSPDAIASTYWQLHQQHSSAWTLEMDLRPAVEKF